MIHHRHLHYPPGTSPEALPVAALADVLDRGDLADWAPLAAAVAVRPHGEVAGRIATIVDASPMYGTSPLWRAWIARCRARAEAPVTAGVTLAQLRQRRGLTQAEVSVRMRISQSDVSKIERRHDVKLSTLRDYLAAVDADIRVVAVDMQDRTATHVLAISAE